MAAVEHGIGNRLAHGYVRSRRFRHLRRRTGHLNGPSVKHCWRCPPEEYDWFDVQAQRTKRGGPTSSGTAPADESEAESTADSDAATGVSEPPLDEGESLQRQFFEFADPLFAMTIAPASSVVRAGDSRQVRALPRDLARRRVESDLTFEWRITDGAGRPGSEHDQVATFHATPEPRLTHLAVTVRQREIVCEVMRSMNCYYSNLIAGHDSAPRDIDRALVADYSTDPHRRDLQLQARAHIEVQRMIDASARGLPAASCHARIHRVDPPGVLRPSARYAAQR